MMNPLPLTHSIAPPPGFIKMLKQIEMAFIEHIHGPQNLNNFHFVHLTFPLQNLNFAQKIFHNTVTLLWNLLNTSMLPLGKAFFF